MASHGHASLAERAAFFVHLALNALNCAATDAALSGNLQHALAGP